MLNRIKLVVIVTFMPVMADILLSCGLLSPCPKPVVGTFEINNIKLDIVSFSQNQPALSSDSVFSGNKFGIKINFTQKVVSHVFEPSRLVSFTSSAMARKCANITMSNVDEVSSIRMVTIYAFDNAHPAMSDVGEYFKVPAEFDNQILYDLEPTIRNKVNKMYIKEDVTNFEYIKLIQAPATSGLHQFKFICTFNSGKVEERITPVIKLLN